ncbi:MAG: hypothetical protein AAGI08_17135 [Bacteroidota bacterium]
MVYRPALASVLFLFVLLAAPWQSATAQTAEEYVEQLLVQLDAAADVFEEEGFLPVMADGDVLEQGESQLYTVTLEEGISYLLLGVCDEDCSDLDLELYDGYDNLISEDDMEDDAPVVDVFVKQSGDFTLKVTMYACSENPCYYGVGVYGN